MQRLVVWTLIIFVITVSVLPGSIGNDSQAINPILKGQTGHIDFDVSLDSNPFFSINLLNMPSIPRLYCNSLPNGIERQWIDLSWTNLKNPHSIIIYAPDTSLGPFHNIDDGRIDQRIYLEILSPRNLTPGTWYYTIQADGTSTGENEYFRIYRECEGILPLELES
ncbi:hypothetical protein ACKUB1_10675 [Methanospirillum stamsii]|nr:hypothetical protein [Methanospirillum stamsii]